MKARRPGKGIPGAPVTWDTQASRPGVRPPCLDEPFSPPHRVGAVLGQGPDGGDHLRGPSAASDTQTNSLSLRATTHRPANAGWLQTTLRPRVSFVGSTSLARLISSYPRGLSFAITRWPVSLMRKKRSPFFTRNAVPAYPFLSPVV